jgi:hypothetical protein
MAQQRWCHLCHSNTRFYMTTLLSLAPFMRHIHPLMLMMGQVCILSLLVLTCNITSTAFSALDLPVSNLPPENQHHNIHLSGHTMDECYPPVMTSDISCGAYSSENLTGTNQTPHGKHYKRNRSKRKKEAQQRVKV